MANTSTVLYIFFKFFLRSKVIPLTDMDLQSEFTSMREEQEVLDAEGWREKKSIIHRVLHAF